MSRFPLSIQRYMTSVLVVISPSRPLAEAIRLMRLHEVRHLPVVTKGKIVGLISQRDVYLMQSIEKSDPSTILVSEAMTQDPYTVEPDEPVDAVAREMVRRKIGTALVSHGDRLMGLFSATDALLALAALVEDDRIPTEAEPEQRETTVVPKGRSRSKAKSARKRTPSARAVSRRSR
ncbi:MAG TPA: CBS domain-containing protein [Planctomycetota bacterium]|jgi:acetoin utilization protein AcuB|nr:CBS domain-containing protein [Planctomycetota bacterium]